MTTLVLRWRVPVMLAGILALLSCAAAAAPGDLDPTFGHGGTALAGLGGGSDEANALAIQGNGGIVAAGWAQNGTAKAFAAIRLKSDGTPDFSFGNGGRVLVTLGSRDDVAAAMRLDASGRIVLAGSSQTDVSIRIAVVRLNPDGSPDQSFNATGKLVLPIAGEAKAMAIDAAGRLILAGITYFDGNQQAIVVRLNANGTIDSTFGSGGSTILAVTSAATAVVPDANGRILVASLAGVTRLTAGGAVDAAFGQDGTLSPGATPAAIAVDGLGRIVIATTTGGGFACEPFALCGVLNGTVGPSRFTVIRFDADGKQTDPTFGANGMARVDDVPAPGAYFVQSLAIDTAGRLLIGGKFVTSTFDITAPPVMARLTQSGAVDTTFGQAGTFISANESSFGVVAIAVGGSGLPVAAWTRYQGSPNTIFMSPTDVSDLTVVRLTSAGLPDTTFGGTGKVVRDVGNTPSGSSAIARQADGKLVVLGDAAPGGNSFSAALTNSPVISGMVRLNLNGAIDPEFGDNGRRTISFAGAAQAVNALTKDANGRILVAGWVSATAQPFFSFSPSGVEDFAIARFSATGAPDTGFGAGGVLTIDVTGQGDIADRIVVDAAGRIVVAGFSYVNSQPKISIVRLTPAGALDGGFGSGGKMLFDMPTVIGMGGIVAGLQIDSLGRIVVAARAPDGAIVLRVLDSGAADTTLAPAGWIAVPGIDVADLAISQDGKLVLAGGRYDANTGNVFVVVRLADSGAPDSSFGTNGRVQLSFGPGYRQDYAHAVAMQPDGRIVVAGGSRINNPAGFEYDMAIARLAVDGTPDAGFGAGGKSLISLSATPPEFGTSFNIGSALGVLIDPAGAIIAAGRGTNLLTAVRLQGVDGPSAFSFTPRLDVVQNTATTSNIITIAGMYAPSTIGVTGGSYNINGGPFVASAGTVANGDTVTVRMTSAAGYGTTTLATLTIGGTSGVFSVTTQSAPAGDTTAPSIPAGLAATVVSSSRIDLAWSASTDNVGVTRYQVYRNGATYVAVSAPATYYSDTGLAAAIAYTYTVAACDATANCSAQSPSAVATTTGHGQLTVTPQLEPGFNLGGNALNFTLDVMSIFGNQDAPVAGVTANVISVWKWNAAQARWAFFSPQLTGAGNASYAASHGFDVLAAINAGEGYWMNAVNPMTLPAQTATPFVWTGLNFAVLAPGFNLIAHAGAVTPSQFNSQVNATPPSPGVVPTGNFVSLWVWDAAAGKWFFYSPLLESSGGLDAVKAYADSHNYQHFQDFGKVLGIGNGFWVNRP